MTTQQIKEAVESFFQVDLKNRSRTYDMIKVRFFYFHLAFNYSSNFVTLREIGELIGYNHATVIHGKREFDYIYDQDKVFQKHCDKFLEETDLSFTKVTLPKKEIMKKIEFHLKKIKELNALI